MAPALPQNQQARTQKPGRQIAAITAFFMPSPAFSAAIGLSFSSVISGRARHFRAGTSPRRAPGSPSRVQIGVPDSTARTLPKGTLPPPTSWVINRIVFCAFPTGPAAIPAGDAGEKIQGEKARPAAANRCPSDHRAGKGRPLPHTAGQLSGLLSRQPSSPTSARAASTSSRRSALGIPPAISRGRAAFSPPSAREKAILLGHIAAVSLSVPNGGAIHPDIPPLGLKSPLIMRKMVLLPQPLTPRTQ